MTEEEKKEMVECYKEMSVYQKPRAYVAEFTVGDTTGYCVEVYSVMQRQRLLKLKKIELGEYSSREEAQAYVDQWEKDNPRTVWEDFQ